MTFKEFLNKYNGKPVEVSDPTNRNQCFDLVVAWTDSLGIPRIFPFLYAYQIYTAFGYEQSKYFDRIVNTPEAVPKEGDIVVWSGNYNAYYKNGKKILGAGHTAIATGKGDIKTFEAFAQNDPTGTYSVLKTYNYSHVIGWLRPKIKPAPFPNPIPLPKGRKYTALPYVEKPVAPGNFGVNGRLPIKKIVYHTTDGTLAGTLAWFNNSQSGVSSNYVIDIEGKTIYAMLEEFFVPYTNGNLTSNRESITIEVVDNKKPFEPRADAVYALCAKLGKDIAQYYKLPINRDVFKGHREVSNSHPSCPGSLDVNRIVSEALGASPFKQKCDLQRIAIDRVYKEHISDLANPGVNYESVFNSTKAKVKKIYDTGTL